MSDITWSPLDGGSGDSDPVKDIEAMRDAMRDSLSFGSFNPAKEFPTHVLRHECGHVVGYYRVWLPERYAESLRCDPCPICRA